MLVSLGSVQCTNIWKDIAIYFEACFVIGDLRCRSAFQLLTDTDSFVSFGHFVWRLCALLGMPSRCWLSRFGRACSKLCMPNSLNLRRLDIFWMKAMELFNHPFIGSYLVAKRLLLQRQVDVKKGFIRRYINWWPVGHFVGHAAQPLPGALVTHRQWIRAPKLPESEGNTFQGWNFQAKKHLFTSQGMEGTLGPLKIGMMSDTSEFDQQHLYPRTSHNVKVWSEP